MNCFLPASSYPATQGLVLAAACLALACLPAGAADTTRPAQLNVQVSAYGRMPDRTPVELYTLSNSRGMVVRVISYGATLIGVETPDRDGRFDNITLYLDSWDEYLAGHPSFGSTIGRYANRIANARFTIDGREYEVTRNATPHHIHGGQNGFSKQVWTAKPFRDKDSVGVEFVLTSPDGQEGYPGTVKVRALYRLNDRNELTLEYFGETDKPTHLNLTNHMYWNLGGATSGPVLDHRLTLFADQFLAVDEKKIPTGELESVKGTPFDFLKPHTIGERIEQVGGGGYDHCYVIPQKKAGRPTKTAVLEDPESGRVMEMSTTQPGVQLYTANHLSERFRAGGKPYGPHHAVCLEAQAFPDAPNKPQFPSSLLRPGETYHQVITYRFSVKK